MATCQSFFQDQPPFPNVGAQRTCPGARGRAGAAPSAFVQCGAAPPRAAGSEQPHDAGVAAGIGGHPGLCGLV